MPRIKSETKDVMDVEHVKLREVMSKLEGKIDVLYGTVKDTNKQISKFAESMTELKVLDNRVTTLESKSNLLFKKYDKLIVEISEFKISMEETMRKTSQKIVYIVLSSGLAFFGALLLELTHR